MHTLYINFSKTKKVNKQKEEKTMKKGLFITFEGGEGCGKSTQVRQFKEYVSSLANKDDFVFIREPGGTGLGEKIRQLLLGDQQDPPVPMAELLLFCASRAQIVEEVIRPALNEGKIVVADRFIDSTIAYQSCARGILSPENVKKLHEMFMPSLKPDITFYLRITPAEAFARKKDDVFDRMELEGLSFHEKVLAGYDSIASTEPERVKVIDATKSIEEIHNSIIGIFENKVNQIEKTDNESRF